jgi:hypothetical protein
LFTSVCIGDCPEQDKFNPRPHIIFKIYFNIIFPCVPLGLSSDLFPSGILLKILYVFLIYPVRATFSTYLILPDFITIVLCGEECKWWSSSLHSFPQPPVNSSLLSLNILLGVLVQVLLVPPSGRAIARRLIAGFSPWRPVLFTAQSTWNLWWTKRHWDRFFSRVLRFPLSISLHCCSIFTHVSSGWSKMGPLTAQFHRDIISPHSKKVIVLPRQVSHKQNNR